MKLKQAVTKLNKENFSNAFRLTALAAKRDRKRGGSWRLIRFVNRSAWRDFSVHKVELYEIIPKDWPLSDIAKRLDCSIEELHVIERYNPKAGRWEKVEDLPLHLKKYDAACDRMEEEWLEQYDQRAKKAGY